MPVIGRRPDGIAFVEEVDHDSLTIDRDDLLNMTVFGLILSI